MKILHVTTQPYASTYGGLEIYLRYLLPEQAERGLEVSVLSILFDEEGENITFSELPAEKNIRVLELHLPKKWRRLHVESYGNAIKENLKRLLGKERPDVCHCHLGFTTQVIQVCKELGIRSVFTIHVGEVFCINGLLMKQGKEECDGICDERKCLHCCGHFLPTPWLWERVARWTPRPLRIKLEELLPHLPFIYFLTPLFQETYFLRTVQKNLEILAQETDVVIAPSHAVAELAKRQSVDFRNVQVVLHGIPEVVPPPYPPFDENGTVHFYYVGRICFYKGIHHLLEAFSSLKHCNWKLHIIGEPVLGIEKKYAKKLKEKYVNPKVIWHGKIAHAELPALLAGFHVMIHPALCFEIFGLTVAEALALGKPVLSTACGGPESQITPGVNGWFVKRNSSIALAKKIEEILEKPEVLQRLHKNCTSQGLGAHLDELMKVYQGRVID